MLSGQDVLFRLTDVLVRMKALKSVPDSKADGRALRELFREVAPGHDEEKVYASDMKKIVSWYHILKDMPLFTEAEPTETVAEEPVAEPEPVKTAKPAKTAKKAEPADETAAPKKAKAKK